MTAGILGEADHVIEVYNTGILVVLIQKHVQGSLERDRGVHEPDAHVVEPIRSEVTFEYRLILADIIDRCHM